MSAVKWQRSPGFFFDIDKGFEVEDVKAAWSRITDFKDATDPEEDRRNGIDHQMELIAGVAVPSKL